MLRRPSSMLLMVSAVVILFLASSLWSSASKVGDVENQLAQTRTDVNRLAASVKDLHAELARVSGKLDVTAAAETADRTRGIQTGDTVEKAIKRVSDLEATVANIGPSLKSELEQLVASTSDTLTSSISAVSPALESQLTDVRSQVAALAQSVEDKSTEAPEGVPELRADVEALKTDVQQLLRMASSTAAKVSEAVATTKQTAEATAAAAAAAVVAAAGEKRRAELEKEEDEAAGMEVTGMELPKDAAIDEEQATGEEEEEEEGVGGGGGGGGDGDGGHVEEEGALLDAYNTQTDLDEVEGTDGLTEKEYIDPDSPPSNDATDGVRENDYATPQVPQPPVQSFNANHLRARSAYPRAQQ